MLKYQTPFYLSRELNGIVALPKCLYITIYGSDFYIFSKPIATSKYLRCLYNMFFIDNMHLLHLSMEESIIWLLIRFRLVGRLNLYHQDMDPGMHVNIYIPQHFECAEKE